MSHTFIIEEEAQLLEVVELIEQWMSDTDRTVVLLNGDMGSGKTTLVKQWLDPSHEGSVSSPTFSIVNEYELEGHPIYHFDLYRIEHAEELSDIGFEEYLDSGHPCLIEWPSIAAQFLDIPHIHVDISVKGELRSVTVELRNKLS